MSLTPWTPGGNIVVEARDAAGVFHPFPFLTTAGRTPGTPRVTSTTFLDGTSISDTVPPEVGTFQFTGRSAREFLANVAAHEAFLSRASLLIRKTRGEPKQRLDNSVAQNTVAISAAGVLTVAGAINLLSSLDWQPGIGLVIANVLYIVQGIDGAMAGRVTRHGPVSSGVSTKGGALAVVAATADWEIVEYAEIEELTGTVNSAGGEQIDANRVSTQTVEFQLSDQPDRSKLRVAAAA